MPLTLEVCSGQRRGLVLIRSACEIGCAAVGFGLWCRFVAELEAAGRLTDRIGLGVLTRVVGPDPVDEVLVATGRTERRRRLLPGDLVSRSFTRSRPNQLWVTDITEHHTREGKVYCAVVLDTFSRRVVGWSIDSTQTAALVTNALGMAIANRSPRAGTIIHSDHGVQFTPWAFTDRARQSGLVPSMGSIGDCYDNAVIESFWGRMQIELLNRQRWRTRIELANAIFEYLEIFHNRRRRHSALGMRSPIEYEMMQSSIQPVA